MNQTFAIVDIETTGGYAQHNRIVEIAILLTDGQKVLQTYEQLINPQCYISPHVSAIHGIYEKDILDAPTFEEVAYKVHEMLQGAVFVAHSVHFDFSFVKNELFEAGYSINPPKLCTVRLSRKIVPGLKSYSLGTLCDTLSIPLENRHRAMGDAAATTLLFHHLFKQDGEGVITKSLKKNNKEGLLPEHLDRLAFEELPESSGLYFFKDNKGKTIYIGKAINIKKRVYSHFSGSKMSLEKQAFQKEIHQVAYELTGNELLAFIQESLAIKKYWPKYNRSQKKPHTTFGLLQYSDQNGYVRLLIAKKKKGMRYLTDFSSFSEARAFMFEFQKRHQLCPKLCGIQTCADTCYDFPLGNCAGACGGHESVVTYNAKLNVGLGELRLQKTDYVLLGSGRKADEKSVIWIEKGIYKGHFYYSENTKISESLVKENILFQETTPFIQHYIQSAFYAKGHQVMYLNEYSAQC